MKTSDSFYFKGEQDEDSKTGKWRFLKASWLQNHRINLRLTDNYPCTG